LKENGNGNGMHQRNDSDADLMKKNSRINDKNGNDWESKNGHNN